MAFAKSTSLGFNTAQNILYDLYLTTCIFTVQNPSGKCYADTSNKDDLVRLVDYMICISECMNGKLQERYSFTVATYKRFDSITFETAMLESRQMLLKHSEHVCTLKSILITAPIDYQQKLSYHYSPFWTNLIHKFPMCAI